ncbi:MAG TPA: hypothetical protein EYO34_00480, partial [Candidatus Marinimicrobia bacterium]|nr:hypothetical protein [Candidatus Neomarinimicrobiota bacterium]
MSLNIRFSDLAYNAGDNVTTTTDGSAVLFDKTPPTVSEETAVPNPTNDNTSSYTFTSNEAGTITYGGSCSSSSNDNISVVGNNTITFNALPDGTYDNCTITVTDNASNPITQSVTSFTIDTTAPTLNEVTKVPTPTSDNTSDYTFSSDEIGTIAYGGSCSSSSNDNISVVGDNTITFNALADGAYSNCKISVTDNATNTSDNLTVSEFTIGATKPALAEVTAVPNPTNDNTSNYTFFSTLSGTIN